MNFVIVMTDTQNKCMVGAYGQKEVCTPNLDNLASEGVRFDRAYTACPVCTPARGALFSGLHPQSNGAFANALAPYANIKMMGTIFKERGYRAAYCGKWHLDGDRGYMGGGVADGGFESQWWYDGNNYLADIGPEMAPKFGPMTNNKAAGDLRTDGFTRDYIWGKRVADRAVGFLESVGEEPFVLVVSFDEPHEPCFAPPEYWEKFTAEQLRGMIPSVNDDMTGKPEMQKLHFKEAQERGQRHGWGGDDFLTKLFGCNSYIDLEIGRVLDAVSALHGDDTTVIYTSDHGVMLGSHGLHSKGSMMYEETCNIPFIIKAPGISKGVVSDSAVSHIDILPTMFDLAGFGPFNDFHGKSLTGVMKRPCESSGEYRMLSFNRFGLYQSYAGGFYPIRCAADGRYKLSINLFDVDEFYDATDDPGESINRIDDPSYAPIRNKMHEWLLDEMDRVNDPFRCSLWGDRTWNKIRQLAYYE